MRSSPRLAARLLRRSAGGLLSFLFPDSCLSCGAHLGWNERHVCTGCSSTVSPELRSLSLMPGPGPGTEVVFAVDYDGAARELIRALKYDRRLSIAPLLADVLASALQGRIDSTDVHMIVPVPLHRVRARERGFNQSELIGRSLSEMMGVDLCTRAVTRVRATSSQTGLTRGERLVNVTGAFRAETVSVSGRKVLLLDDVVTTGATMAAASETLRRCGAAGVVCVAVARSLKAIDSR